MNTNKKIQIACLTLIAAMTVHISNAQILVFGMDGQTKSPTTINSNITATDLDGSSITGSALTYETRASGVRGNPTPSLFWKVGDYNNGYNVLDDYIAFSISPDPGFQIEVTSISVDHFNSTGAGANVYFFSGQDGFSSTSDAIGSVFLADYDSTLNFEAEITPILATITSTTEFRIYFDTTATFASGDVWADNITLNGTVSLIPEPSTLALFGLAGLAAMAFRRRK